MTPAAAQAESAQERALRSLGVPQAQIEAQRRSTEDAFVLWSWHWNAVRLFDAMRAQWRMAPGLKPYHQGLDLVALPVALKQLGFEEREPELFQELRVMERAALKHLNGVVE